MNITTLDILYLVLAAGFISCVIFLNMVLYNVWLIVKEARKSIENVQSVTKGVLNTKDKVKLTVLHGIKNLIAKLKK